jgi:hypothetical protein
MADFNSMTQSEYENENRLGRLYAEFLISKKPSLLSAEYIRLNNDNHADIDALFKFQIEQLCDIQTVRNSHFVQQEKICIDVISSCYEDLPAELSFNDLDNKEVVEKYKIRKFGKIKTLGRLVEEEKRDISYLICIDDEFLTPYLRKNYQAYIYKDVMFLSISVKRMIHYLKRRNPRVIQNVKRNIVESWNSAYVLVDLQEAFEKTPNSISHL